MMAEDQGLGAQHHVRSGTAAWNEALAIDACPFLLAASGAWRASTPSGEHRCTAVAPAVPLDTGKQQRLCLVPAHVSCATFVAATTARRERGAVADEPAPIRWGVARTTPVVDVGIGVGAAFSRVVADRRGWQAIPAVVLVLALGAVGLSGFGRNQPATGLVPSMSAVASPTAVSTSISTAGTAGPTSTLGPSAKPTATRAPTSTTSAPTPTPRPTPTPAPSARMTYTVKAGDSLYGIAGTFGTTVAAIKELNGLTSNTIRVGLVLLIP